jgi:N-acetylmuramoyl-L-alanine amidase
VTTLRGALALALITATPVMAQQPPGLRVERAEGDTSTAAVSLDRGYAAVDLTLFGQLGWTVSESGTAVTIAVPNEIRVSLRVGSPYFTWDGIVLQLADAPYRDAGHTWVPAQLLTDFFPRRLPDLYEFDGPGSLLRAGDPRPAGAGSTSPAQGRGAQAPAPTQPTPDLPSAPSPYHGPRVVIIDAGHGGEDPGALGPRGLREKDVALAIAKDLQAILKRDSNLEVHMIRDDDTFVDLWQRGQIATDIKGDRPGLFVSIHANSFPNQRSTRGFETYFLSEARTEHERRVSAIENAPLSFQGQDVDPDAEPDQVFILRDLKNLDTQHWSALLAGFVQDELSDFHPGPDRGVKQGVLAVLTNALMPSVLVETGYLSNADEAKLLGDPSFQQSSAQAVARAVERFFERYPPGNGVAGSGEEE